MKDRIAKLQQRLQELEPLVQELKQEIDPVKRCTLLKKNPAVQQILAQQNEPALSNNHIALMLCASGAAHLASMVDLGKLHHVDQFYAPIGGLLGYYCCLLKCLVEGQKHSSNPLALSRASGFDLSSSAGLALEEGLRAVPHMAEMYPIGGLATRLEYCDENGRCLPAAMLPFCGVSLLEGLIRDVEGREALYYKVFGQKVWIPLAFMISDENEKAVLALLDQHNWFNRPRDSFFLFRQPSVPVITEEGEWVLSDASNLALQPGGHGAIWQAALSSGVFDWLRQHQRHHLLIRQINNPLAGLDHALLSFVGLGKRENKAFGFICCEREPEAAEGVVVLIEEMGKYRISNIEYTHVKAYGIEDATHLPANTNILYVNLDQLETAIKEHPLPEFVLNMKSEIEVIELSSVRKVMGGRLESMMQGVSNYFKAQTWEQLPTFLAYQKRSRTMSTTKRKFVGSLLETPEGAFYDLMRNAHELLTLCDFTLPAFCSQQAYLQEGPSLIFCYHPCLGPLYSVIKQKLKHGKLSYGSELQIESTDVFMEHVDIEGSLCVQGAGKGVFKNVTIRNKGVEPCQRYWDGQYQRQESVIVILNGTGEFHIEGVELKGSHVFDVPDAQRWVLNSHGLVKKPLERPTWQWHYVLTPEGFITCHIETGMS
ncbi:MAG: UTP--glucose-1-phosphate uridylyltransferase [Verrucomicrobia bacterium]|nr:UTP--glucose-1-phosphate uridylyltransferase [Verrucomicrobiota bacterium]MBS0646532.1 UTP--glucose-1-phosphate uridylyltransferase [Verrucomicrobiota bacterium]